MTKLKLLPPWVWLLSLCLNVITGALTLCLGASFNFLFPIACVFGAFNLLGLLESMVYRQNMELTRKDQSEAYERIEVD